MAARWNAAGSIPAPRRRWPSPEARAGGVWRRTRRSPRMTRILVLNGNPPQAVPDRIAEAARAAAPAGVTTEAMTAPYGLPLIVPRADWLLSGPPILEALAAKRGT